MRKNVRIDILEVTGDPLKSSFSMLVSLQLDSHLERENGMNREAVV